MFPTPGWGGRGKIWSVSYPWLGGERSGLFPTPGWGGKDLVCFLPLAGGGGEDLVCFLPLAGGGGKIWSVSYPWLGEKSVKLRSWSGNERGAGSNPVGGLHSTTLTTGFNTFSDTFWTHFKHIFNSFLKYISRPKTFHIFSPHLSTQFQNNQSKHLF